MTAPANPAPALYMMTQRNIATGKEKIVYGHATGNVMSEFWQAYIDDQHTVEIQQVLQGASGVPSMMATPRVSKMDAAKCINERGILEDMIERYFGALHRGILTPEEALRNLRLDYSHYSGE